VLKARIQAERFGVYARLIQPQGNRAMWGGGVFWSCPMAFLRTIP